MTKSIAKKSTAGSLPPAVPLAITPTFSPWTHTSDDSYIYQLSLVLATATVSYIIHVRVKDMLQRVIKSVVIPEGGLEYMIARILDRTYICKRLVQVGSWPGW